MKIIISISIELIGKIVVVLFDELSLTEEHISQTIVANKNYFHLLVT